MLQRRVANAATAEPSGEQNKPGAELEQNADEPERRVANAATAELSGEQDKPGAELEQNAAKPSGAPFEPEQHAAAAEPGSTLEQHAAAAEPRPPLAPQPGEPSERDYTVAAQPGEDPGHAVSAVADPDPEGPGPSGAPLEMAINVPDALDAAAERALAAARPALDFAAEANAPAVRRSLPPGFVPKKPCFIRCPSCFDKSCPGTFSSKTCVVYAATEPIAAAEPEGAPDEPEQRVAIAAAVPAEPGSAPVEPELHAAANEPPPPWTALTVPNSRSRTRRLAHARALARAAVAAASRANTDASASRVARAPNAHARRGFFDAQDEADEQRRRGISFMFAIFGSPPPAPTSPREPRPRHPFFSWAVLWADSRGAG